MTVQPVFHGRTLRQSTSNPTSPRRRRPVPFGRQYVSTIITAQFTIALTSTPGSYTLLPPPWEWTVVGTGTYHYRFEASVHEVGDYYLLLEFAPGVARVLVNCTSTTNAPQSAWADFPYPDPTQGLVLVEEPWQDATSTLIGGLIDLDVPPIFPP